MFWGKAALIALATAGLLSAGTLSEAVQSGDQEQVQRLLKAHADVNLADADGTTPLEWAVYADDLRTAQLLLRAGANPSTAEPLWRHAALAGRHQSKRGDGRGAAESRRGCQRTAPWRQHHADDRCPHGQSGNRAPADRTRRRCKCQGQPSMAKPR